MGIARLAEFERSQSTIKEGLMNTRWMYFLIVAAVALCLKFTHNLVGEIYKIEREVVRLIASLSVVGLAS